MWVVKCCLSFSYQYWLLNHFFSSFLSEKIGSEKRTLAKIKQTEKKRTYFKRTHFNTFSFLEINCVASKNYDLNLRVKKTTKTKNNCKPLRKRSSLSLTTSKKKLCRWKACKSRGNLIFLNWHIDCWFNIISQGNVKF